jgi:hypothetical protein
MALSPACVLVSGRGSLLPLPFVMGSYLFAVLPLPHDGGFDVVCDVLFVTIFSAGAGPAPWLHVVHLYDADHAFFALAERYVRESVALNVRLPQSFASGPPPPMVTSSPVFSLVLCCAERIVLAQVLICRPSIM